MTKVMMKLLDWFLQGLLMLFWLVVGLTVINPMGFMP